jgi:hypothetical protein
VNDLRNVAEQQVELLLDSQRSSMQQRLEIGVAPEIIQPFFPEIKVGDEQCRRLRHLSLAGSERAAA